MQTFFHMVGGAIEFFFAGGDGFGRRLLDALGAVVDASVDAAVFLRLDFFAHDVLRWQGVHSSVLLRRWLNGRYAVQLARRKNAITARIRNSYEQYLGDPRGGTGDAGKTKESRDDSDNQKKPRRNAT